MQRQSTMKQAIYDEARRLYGSGKQFSAFIQGGEYTMKIIPRINSLAMQAYYTALRRGKTATGYTQLDTFYGIFEELKEFREASERTHSAHLPDYTEAAEELADIAITCFTELYRRGIDVEKIITDKIAFNETR